MVTAYRVRSDEMLVDLLPQKINQALIRSGKHNNPMGEVNNLYVGVLACPHSGALGLITKMQYGYGIDDLRFRRLLIGVLLEREGIEYRKLH